MCAWLVAAPTAWAQGVSTQGNTGGLAIPWADVLASGQVAASVGNNQEPALGHYSKHQNYSLGVGLLPNLELYGRFAEYQNPQPGSILVSGPRDLSANIKWQLPTLSPRLPKLALGVNDIGGGAPYFKSQYLVAGDRYGLFTWAAGYAHGSPVLNAVDRPKAFNGGFAGVEVAVPGTGLAALAEYDGQYSHAGLRYRSQPMAVLANAQLLTTVQRTGGGTSGGSRTPSIQMSLLFPLQDNARRAEQLVPAHPLPALSPRLAPAAMPPTAQDRQESLLRALVAVGLERVRVGQQGADWVVEYENHRYAHNEADALGLVLGLAAEYAPTGVRRVYALGLKDGQSQQVVSVDVAVFRQFLRDGDASQARSSLALDRSYPLQAVQWLRAKASFHSPIRLVLKPNLNYTLGTEVGAFDYSLAAEVQAILPMWSGAELFASEVQRLSTSANMQPGQVFSGSRQTNGVKQVSVQQSAWLGDQWFVNAGVGRFGYGIWGVQGESSLFVPGRDDVLRLRVSKLQYPDTQLGNQSLTAAASYRWVMSPQTWLEAGAQQYSDGSRGPSAVFTRWFGDVAVRLTYTRGDGRHYAGLEFALPLTPRQGMAPTAVQFSGTSLFSQGVRTRVATGNMSANPLSVSSARNLQLDYNAEAERLNAGRNSQAYFVSQLARMRESFFLYGREFSPDAALP